MFDEVNLSTEAAVDPTEPTKSRRTQRTRREKPHFFDALEYGTKVRKVLKRTHPNKLTRCCNLSLGHRIAFHPDY